MTKEEAKELFEEKHGLAYYEVSAKEGQNIDEIFRENVPKFYEYHK